MTENLDSETNYASDLEEVIDSNRICKLLEILADGEFSDIQVFPDRDIFVKDEKGVINALKEFSEGLINDDETDTGEFRYQGNPKEIEIFETAQIMTQGYPQQEYIRKLLEERRKPSSQRTYIQLNPFNIAYEPRNQTGRFRINFSFTETSDRENYGLSMFIRRIPPSPWTFNDIGFCGPALKLITEIEDGSIHNGLILISGPTNCGKSTTATALIQLFATTFTNYNITTLEDPIEYRFTNDNAIIRQTEIGKHVSTYSEGLKSALRQDPDIIVIQECRDKETARLAYEAARTGHLVVMTFHAYSCADALFKLSKWIEDPSVVARYTVASISQLLIRSDRNQKHHETAPRRINVQEVTRPRKNKDLINALESRKSIKEISSTIKNSIEEQRFAKSLTELVIQGHIKFKKAVNYAEYPEEIEELLQENQS